MNSTCKIHSATTDNNFEYFLPLDLTHKHPGQLQGIPRSPWHDSSPNKEWLLAEKMPKILDVLPNTGKGNKRSFKIFLPITRTLNILFSFDKLSDKSTLSKAQGLETLWNELCFYFIQLLKLLPFNFLSKKASNWSLHRSWKLQKLGDRSSWNKEIMFSTH